MAEHYCTEHQEVFFKKGKMRGYAHLIKIDGKSTGVWCNEDAQAVDKLPSQPHDEVLPEHQKEIDEARASVRPPRSTNDSIEAQVAFKGMVELLIAEELDTKEAQATIDWAMGRIALPSVIVTKIKEAKGETIQIDNNKPKASDKVGEDEGLQGDSEC